MERETVLSYRTRVTITCGLYIYIIAFPRKLFFFEVEICRYFHIVSAITLLLCSKCCGNYLSIQGQKLLAEIRYVCAIYKQFNSHWMILFTGSLRNGSWLTILCGAQCALPLRLMQQFQHSTLSSYNKIFRLPMPDENRNIFLHIEVKYFFTKWFYLFAPVFSRNFDWTS